jgi:MFS family permease
VPRSLRQRNYALPWSGQTVSVLGDGIYTIAIALEALHISDHPTTLAYAEAARVAPNAILLLLAGALVDRLPRRWSSSALTSREAWLSPRWPFSPQRAC